MPSVCTSSDYSREWPAAFEAEAAVLRELLGPALVTIHHVGSTSVPGLAAKPIIDLMPITHDIAAIDAATPRLVDAGYKAWGEYGLPGRRYFTKDRDNIRTHNIHIYQEGNIEITRHLAFRDYLRHHPKACAEYAAFKRAAYARHPTDIMAYNDYKDAWIKRTEQVALDWHAGRTS